MTGMGEMCRIPGLGRGGDKQGPGKPQACAGRPGLEQTLVARRALDNSSSGGLGVLPSTVISSLIPKPSVKTVTCHGRCSLSLRPEKVKREDAPASAAGRSWLQGTGDWPEGKHLHRQSLKHQAETHVD